MARTLNRWQGIGRLGRDPEIRTGNNGQIANLTIACSDTWTKNGEKQERTYWARVVVFGKTAEIVEKYFHKGDRVYVEGTLTERKWKDQSGQDRYSTETVIDDFRGDIQNLTPRSEREDGSTPQQSRQPVPQSRSVGSGGSMSDRWSSEDDEIPF